MILGLETMENATAVGGYMYKTPCLIKGVALVLMRQVSDNRKA